MPNEKSYLGTKGSLSRRRDSASVSDVCEVAPNQRITGSAFWISFHPDWQIHKVFPKRPITARTQILVHRWGPKTKISALFSRQTYQSLVSSVALTNQVWTHT